MHCSIAMELLKKCHILKELKVKVILKYLWTKKREKRGTLNRTSLDRCLTKGRVKTVMNAWMHRLEIFLKLNNNCWTLSYLFVVTGWKRCFLVCHICNLLPDPNNDFITLILSTHPFCPYPKEISSFLCDDGETRFSRLTPQLGP